MASSKNDALLTRTVEGSHNYYDNHRSCGTAMEKGLASRMGGHSYNPVSNSDHHEIYFTGLRHGDHFVDKQGRHTEHLFGNRRRKFAAGGDDLMKASLCSPDAHPREHAQAQRRTELQLTQMENPQSFKGFQQRSSSLFPSPPPKRYSINNARYAHEAEKLRVKMSGKAEWIERRGEVMHMSASAPNLALADPAGSLERAVRQDARKEAMQRQTESAHFAPRAAANTMSCSLDATREGREHAMAQRHLSVHRIENHDMAVSRKNNHYSSQDKLTRSDPFFMRPRLGVTSNSVKYDIVSNERRWFRY